MPAVEWTFIGIVVALVLLVVLLVRLVAGSRQRRLRRLLGLSPDSRLTTKEAQALQAFEDTDMRLRKTFPKMSDTQRRSIARDVLRDRGVLPGRK